MLVRVICNHLETYLPSYCDGINIHFFHSDICRMTTRSWGKHLRRINYAIYRTLVSYKYCARATRNWFVIFHGKPIRQFIQLHVNPIRWRFNSLLPSCKVLAVISMLGLLLPTSFTAITLTRYTVFGTSVSITLTWAELGIVKLLQVFSWRDLNWII